MVSGDTCVVAVATYTNTSADVFTPADEEAINQTSAMVAKDCYYYDENYDLITFQTNTGSCPDGSYVYDFKCNTDYVYNSDKKTCVARSWIESRMNKCNNTGGIWNGSAMTCSCNNGLSASCYGGNAFNGVCANGDSYKCETTVKLNARQNECTESHGDWVSTNGGSCSCSSSKGLTVNKCYGYYSYDNDEFVEYAANNGSCPATTPRATQCKCANPSHEWNATSGKCEEPVNPDIALCTNSHGTWSNDRCNCTETYTTYNSNTKQCEIEPSIISNSRKYSCEMYGGTWNASTKVCTCSVADNYEASECYTGFDPSTGEMYKTPAVNGACTSPASAYTCRCATGYNFKSDSSSKKCVEGYSVSLRHTACEASGGTWNEHNGGYCSCSTAKGLWGSECYNAGSNNTPANNGTCPSGSKIYKCGCSTTGYGYSADYGSCVTNVALARRSICVNSSGTWAWTSNDNGTCSCNADYTTVDACYYGRAQNPNNAIPTIFMVSAKNGVCQKVNGADSVPGKCKCQSGYHFNTSGGKVKNCVADS